MGLFSKGGSTVRRVDVMGQVPPDAKLAAGLSKNKFRPIKEDDQERSAGWAFWRSIQRDPDLEKSWLGDFLAVSLRIDTRKVPSSLLNARLEEALESEGAGKALPKARRTAIRDEIKEELLAQMIPTPKTIEAGWKVKGGKLITAATGGASWNDLVDQFKESWGMDLLAPTPGGIATNLGVSVADLNGMEPLTFGDGDGLERDDAMAFLGREFLVWLWHRALEEGGGGPEGDDSCLLVDNMIQFTSESGDIQDASLKKGTPAESPAAFRALLAGMLPVKMRVLLKEGDSEFFFVINSTTLDLGGVKLPPIEGDSQADVAMQRLDAMDMLVDKFEGRFKTFLDERLEDPDALAETITAWARGRID
jgi:hypothetical protein